MENGFLSIYVASVQEWVANLNLPLFIVPTIALAIGITAIIILVKHRKKDGRHR